jgi:HemY protein
MRLGLWVLAALFVGAFAAHFLLGDQGYVLIRFRGYVVEMSVPALVLAFVLAYASIRALRRLWRAPRALGEALAGRSSRKAGDRLTAGLMYMTEGDWTRGERLLTQGVKNSSAPLVNYLMAARAAHEQGARERRNEWLKLACEALPEAEVTILLTQAEMQYGDGELEQALATLQRIQDKEADHRAALALTAKTKIALNDRDGLVDLLPRLARAKLPAAQLAEIAAPALEAAGARANATYEAYAPLWSGLPASVKQTPTVLRTHALVLNRLGKGEQAAGELASALKRDWHADLVRSYGEVKATDPLKQLRKAEDWLKAHPDDGMLLMTAARLCMQNELWGKARSYLESSLALAPNPEAYALYGNLLDRLGESEQAALAYHSGLTLAGKGDLGLPALGAPPTPRRLAGA